MNYNLTVHKLPIYRITRSIYAIAITALLTLSLTGCSANNSEHNEIYQNAVAAFEGGNFAEAIAVLNTIPNHNDNQNIRQQAEKGLLRYEVETLIRNGRYESAANLLRAMPDFPDAGEMRIVAEVGIQNARVEREIVNALSAGNYEGVLDILDLYPEFIDNQDYRGQALAGIGMRTASEEGELETLSQMLTEMFQITSLEVETRNRDVITVVPGGFLNPGTISIVVEFDSVVRLGVENPETIEILRRVGDTVYIREASVQIDILESVVRNYRETERFRSNLMVWDTAEVTAQIFEAQQEHSERMERELGEQLKDVARRSFMNSFEALMMPMGISVVWE